MAIRTIPTTYHGGHQTTITRIVIHATVSPCEPGGAQAVAHYFQRARTGSAHYVVDPGEVVRCVPEDIIAYHAPPNLGSIGIELTDPQHGPARRWDDTPHRQMLARAATLVADIAHRHKVPLHRLTAADLKAGGRGICGHVDVSRAFGQSDHTDPGHGFPWDAFMAAVRGDHTPQEDIMAALPTLGRGDDGWDVKTIRWLLGARGRPPEDLYGTTFDDQLDADVRRFQAAERLDVDGIVGPKTWAALLRLN